MTGKRIVVETIYKIQREPFLFKRPLCHPVSGSSSGFPNMKPTKIKSAAIELEIYRLKIKQIALMVALGKFK